MFVVEANYLNNHAQKNDSSTVCDDIQLRKRKAILMSGKQVIQGGRIKNENDVDGGRRLCY